MQVSNRGLDELGADDNAVRAWLPVAEPDLQTKPVLVCAVDAILWNYHEFLVGTRA